MGVYSLKSTLKISKFISLISLLFIFLLCFAVFVLFEERTIDWISIQEEYRVFNKSFKIGVKDKNIVYASTASSSKKEYCVSCHLGMAGYNPREETVFKSHPDVYHEVIEFDCVVCHKGDPDSLKKCMEPQYGIDRPLKGEVVWSSCLHCHDPEKLPKKFKNYGKVQEVKNDIETTVKAYGCLGCHQFSNRGGVIGLILTEVGREKMSDLTGDYLTVYDRIEDKIKNSKISNPNSIMPVTGIEKKSLALITSYISMNGVVPYSSGRWNIAGNLEAQSGKEIYGYFCSGCHNNKGEGRERGDSPYGVPTLSSKLLSHYVNYSYITRVIAAGKVGTYMAGFRKGHYEDSDESVGNILSAGELESLSSFIKSGAFAEYNAKFDEVAIASCAVCHSTKKKVYNSMTDNKKVAYFKKHPLDYSVEKMCEFEQITYPPLVENVKKGEELYNKLCMHCHDAPADKKAPTREISAPNISDYFQTTDFNDSFFLMNVICGRGDGVPNKWRHIGILKGEYTIDEIVAVVYYLWRSSNE